MKTALFLILTAFSFSSFASDLASTIKGIEYTYDVKCIKVHTSRFALSIGHFDSKTYTVKYHCVSNSTDFVAKIKVRESLNLATGNRETTVRRVNILN